MKRFILKYVKEDGSSKTIKIVYTHMQRILEYIESVRPHFILRLIEPENERFIILETIPLPYPFIVVECFEEGILEERRWYGMDPLTYYRYGGRYYDQGVALE